MSCLQQYLTLAAIKAVFQAVKVIAIIIFPILLMGCKSSSKVVTLHETGKDKYYISDSLKVLIKPKYRKEFPLIVIDGIIFDYPKTQDTIVLPLKKNDITQFIFLNKKVSKSIYGDKNKGAIIINTIALQNSSSDTIKITDITR